MMDDLEIRQSLPDDLASIEHIFAAAFPEEDLLPLVRKLLLDKANVLSLAGVTGGTIVGHVIFTFCKIGGADGVALLGPLAVTPSRHRQGVGTAMIQHGLRHMKEAGTGHAYVLGDPAYYGRFGFEAETGVTPPYPLPQEWAGAWQSLNLAGNSASLRGRLSVPEPWRERSLWTT